MAKYYFNDEFDFIMGRYEDNITLKVNKNDIIYESEKRKFTNSPANWIDVTSPSFISWMKISPINPTRKLYGIIKQDIEGDLTVKITDNYGKRLKKFNGKRRLIMARLTPFGGTHYFLGAAYVGVGAVLSLLSLTFFCCYRKRRSILNQMNPNNE
eukprot:TRINITY_DN6068_c0_g1_i3.p1 TRINITY_DN6068_c0_g1~~TRINITY_DN6068_c0_g1_i3.p1  ORF type:complete len:155 (-),score=45.09 TRINITY_DN6068_c0_g1_i3:54-518(-)